MILDIYQPWMHLTHTSVKLGECVDGILLIIKRYHRTGGLVLMLSILRTSPPLCSWGGETCDKSDEIIIDPYITCADGNYCGCFKDKTCVLTEDPNSTRRTSQIVENLTLPA